LLVAETTVKYRRKSMKEGMQIVNIQNPEWGTFTVLHREVETMWVIRGKSGMTCLSEGDFSRFWEVAK